MKKTLIQEIASLITAYNNCIKSGNEVWRHKHLERIEELSQEYLPSGSGFDSGSTIDVDSSNGVDRIVLETSYHHMNDGGYYCGWSYHRLTIYPVFGGIDWNIEADYSCVDDDDFYQDGFEEYFENTLYYALTQEIE